MLKFVRHMGLLYNWAHKTQDEDKNKQKTKTKTNKEKQKTEN